MSNPLYSGDVLFLNFPYTPTGTSSPVGDAVITSISNAYPYACMTPSQSGFGTNCGSGVNLDNMLTVQIFDAGVNGTIPLPSGNQIVSLSNPLSTGGLGVTGSGVQISYSRPVYVSISDRNGNYGFLTSQAGGAGPVIVSTAGGSSSLWNLSNNTGFTGGASYGDIVYLSQGNNVLHYNGTIGTTGNIYTAPPLPGGTVSNSFGFSSTNLPFFTFTNFINAYMSCTGSNMGVGVCPPSNSPSYNNINCYTSTGCPASSSRRLLWIVVAVIAGLILLFLFFLFLYLIFRSDKPQ